MILAAITTIIFIVFGVIKEDKEVIEAKTDLFKVKMNIDDASQSSDFSNVAEDDCHELIDSSGKDSLNSTMNKWIPSGGTCICCGVDKAMEYLRDSEKFKVIILMTDGIANTKCEIDAVQDTRDYVEKAYKEYEIYTYTIGFGGNMNETFLQEIADIGRGEYYYSDISQISEVYSKTITKIIREYRAEQKWDHLKIVFYNNTRSWVYRHYGVPEPLETITYELPSEGN